MRILIYDWRRVAGYPTAEVMVAAFLDDKGCLMFESLLPDLFEHWTQVMVSHYPTALVVWFTV